MKLTDVNPAVLDFVLVVDDKDELLPLVRTDGPVVDE